MFARTAIDQDSNKSAVFGKEQSPQQVRVYHRTSEQLCQLVLSSVASSSCLKLL